MITAILDTDHISLLQRNDQRILSRLERVNPDEWAVTVISVAEQMRGRLASVRRGRSEREKSIRLQLLAETLQFYLAIQVLPYDDTAVSEFARLRQQKIRIGTQDLRVASIALSRGATLVTRNRRDSGRVPELQVEDWST